jgi:hypothetical protein
MPDASLTFLKCNSSRGLKKVPNVVITSRGFCAVTTATREPSGIVKNLICALNKGDATSFSPPFSLTDAGAAGTKNNRPFAK